MLYPPTATERFVLIHGDCMDLQEGLPALAGLSVHHVITDPPYESEAHTKGRRIKTYLGRGEYGVKSAPLSFAPMTTDLRRAVSREFGRVVLRWVLAFSQAESMHLWQHALTDAKLVYKRACVWIKPDGQPQLTGDRPGVGYETIVAAHSVTPSRWNAGGKIGVYSATRHQDHGPSHERHPTTKPLPLMEALIRDFTDPGDVVCDPFAGSGTTGVAALRLGRRFIGWEIDPRYYEKALKRLTETREQPDLIDMDRFTLEAKKRRTQLAIPGVNEHGEDCNEPDPG
jgi:site-specific DNA-methyltransferase (adenine-specific)